MLDKETVPARPVTLDIYPIVPKPTNVDVSVVIDNVGKLVNIEPSPWKLEAITIPVLI